MAHLNETLDNLTQKWTLNDLVPIKHYGHNLVFSARKQQISVIVKVFPTQQVFLAEKQALQYYQDHGVVKLLDFSDKEQALLLEKIYPGKSLKTLFPVQDMQAMEIAAQLIQRLHGTTQKLTSPTTFKTLAEIVHALHTVNKNTLPHKFLSMAKKYSSALLKSEHPIVLHGDLHHENILLSENNGWIAIDPKGVMGDPVYDTATFICNPMPELIAQNDIADILKNRLGLFADLLQMDVQRIYEWAYIRAMLGACWQIEDDHDPQYFIAVAEILDIL